MGWTVLCFRFQQLVFRLYHLHPAFHLPPRSSISPFHLPPHTLYLSALLYPHSLCFPIPSTSPIFCIPIPSTSPFPLPPRSSISPFHLPPRSSISPFHLPPRTLSLPTSSSCSGRCLCDCVLHNCSKGKLRSARTASRLWRGPHHLKV